LGIIPVLQVMRDEFMNDHGPGLAVLVALAP
jgi:hypothetical protein